MPLTEVPCPRCLALYKAGGLRAEAVQRLPEGAYAPLARDGSGKCCLDCASADAVLDMCMVPDFAYARSVVAYDRQEQYRLPGVPTGLAGPAGLVRPSVPGDHEDQLTWLVHQPWSNRGGN